MTRGDNCPDVYGESNRNNTYGCPDADFDGWIMTKTTLRTNLASGWIQMETGMEMNSMDTKATLCAQEYGLSYNDTFGCPDADGDGWSDQGEIYRSRTTQQNGQILMEIIESEGANNRCIPFRCHSVE